MAFTGRLGTSNSQLGQIELGALGVTVQSASFTADAVLLKTQVGSFTADANLSFTTSASFTANAVIFRTQTASFTADAYISTGGAVVEASFTADAILLATRTGSFTANAVLLKTQVGSFTADAVFALAQTASFTANAAIVVTTRFYLNAATAPAVSPSFESGWESTGSTQRRVMGGPQRANSIKRSYEIAETSTSGTFDVLIYQFISDPIPYTTMICGPAAGLILATESNAAADDRSQMVAKVVSNDGTTVIGTLLDFDASALTDEWPTTAASRRFPLAYAGIGTNVTPVSATAGDRIVVEVGYRAHNTSATSRTGTLRSGHTVGGTDFTAAAQTADNNPWLDLRATTPLRAIEGSFTANAWIRAVISPSFTADAYIPSFRQRHARTGPHTGVDRDLDHTIAWAFDRYQRGDVLRDVLIDLDARITAKEAGFEYQSKRLFGNAIKKATPLQSFFSNAFMIIRVIGSFTANAVLHKVFRGDAWIVDPAIYLADNVLTAPTWAMSTTPRAAFINTSAMTGDATNDPDYYGPSGSYATAWAKFTLSSTKTVILDTIGTDGDTVLELWQSGPGSWPNNPLAYSDDDVANLPGLGYPEAEYIEMSLGAGTYWVLVHMFDDDDPDFNMVLRMQTTT